MDVRKEAYPEKLPSAVQKDTSQSLAKNTEDVKSEQRSKGVNIQITNQKYKEPTCS